ncbi:YdhR family protein [Falsiroseomonas sp.]|jgi:hypothetical protein|uniref:YdhR family protein n=1 Tax=Falsiroseomonas sp. TaxID=2870721 RepID=UPI003F6FC7DE
MADGPVVIFVDFANHDFSAERTAALKPMAEEIGRAPGFLWKIWTEDRAAGRAGGVYLFESRALAETYVEAHRVRLAKRGVQEMVAEYRTINATLSAINGAPVPPG